MPCCVLATKRGEVLVGAGPWTGRADMLSGQADVERTDTWERPKTGRFMRQKAAEESLGAGGGRGVSAQEQVCLGWGHVPGTTVTDSRA